MPKITKRLPEAEDTELNVNAVRDEAGDKTMNKRKLTKRERLAGMAMQGILSADTE